MLWPNLLLHSIQWTNVMLDPNVRSFSAGPAAEALIEGFIAGRRCRIDRRAGGAQSESPSDPAGASLDAADAHIGP